MWLLLQDKEDQASQQSIPKSPATPVIYREAIYSPEFNLKSNQSAHQMDFCIDSQWVCCRFNYANFPAISPLLPVISASNLYANAQNALVYSRYFVISN